MLVWSPPQKSALESTSAGTLVSKVELLLEEEVEEDDGEVIKVEVDALELENDDEHFLLFCARDSCRTRRMRRNQIFSP